MLKLCQQSNEEQRYGVNSPQLFEYDEGAYSCPAPYTNSDMSRQHDNSRSMSVDHQQNYAGSTSSLSQPSINMASPHMVSSNQVLGPNYSQSHSPASTESVAAFTPSPARPFDYPQSPSTKPSIPANTDYPGEFDFQIDFGELTDYAPKSAQYTYSKSLNKLFVKMNVTCPIRFKCATKQPIPGCLIRAVPVFKRPEHVTDVVTRCPNHRIPDEVHYIPSGHLIRAESTNECHVNYHTAPDGRESVTVLYERPQVGAEYSTVLYKFMCLSSCVGGINRRPLLTCFTLEKDGQVLGRRVVEVRICSCPGRDRSQEERRKNGKSNSNQGIKLGKSSSNNFRYSGKNFQGSVLGGGKRRRQTRTSNGSNCDSDTESYVLHIRGREKFEYLKKMKEALDLMDMISPGQIEAYRSKDEEEQNSFIERFQSALKPNNIQPQQQETSPPNKFHTISTETLQLLSNNSASTIPTFPQSSIQTSNSSSCVSPNATSLQGNSVSYWGFVDQLPLGCDVPDVTSALAGGNKETWLESVQENNGQVNMNGNRLNSKQVEEGQQTSAGITILQVPMTSDGGRNDHFRSNSYVQSSSQIRSNNSSHHHHKDLSPSDEVYYLRAIDMQLKDSCQDEALIKREKQRGGNYLKTSNMQLL